MMNDESGAIFWIVELSNTIMVKSSATFSLGGDDLKLYFDQR